MSDTVQMSCPLPIMDHETVQMAHGGGGRLMNDLIDSVFAATFREETAPLHDGERLDVPTTQLAFSTDSYVVKPLFFPGGDIGSLSINGTTNDLSMCGARPLYLSAGFILEEGLPIQTLWDVVQSMHRAASVAGVRIVTGDTKVVDRGKGDGVYINTAGVGAIMHDQVVGPDQVQTGDVILVSGDLGRHGTAIMAAREGLTFDGAIESDCAPLCGVVRDLLDEGIRVRCMRDLTRGGLSSALVEIAEASSRHLHIVAKSVSVDDTVRGACELLGLDPLYVANEGRMVLFVPADDEARALACLQRHDVCEHAAVIGQVRQERPGRVTIESEIGTTRYLDMLSGEQLPRIC